MHSTLVLVPRLPTAAAGTAGRLAAKDGARSCMNDDNDTDSDSDSKTTTATRNPHDNQTAGPFLDLRALLSSQAQW